MEYCMAAASSPFARPNCSSSMLPKRGSGTPIRTVYINCLTGWYMSECGARKVPEEVAMTSQVARRRSILNQFRPELFERAREGHGRTGPGFRAVSDNLQMHWRLSN